MIKRYLQKGIMADETRSRDDFLEHDDPQLMRRPALCAQAERRRGLMRSR
jgi:hypothetical protein